MSEHLPLVDLLTALRADGFAIGVDDHVRFARILAMDSDWTTDKLRCALRSVVATDVRSRARFDRVFERVFEPRADGLAGALNEVDDTRAGAGRSGAGWTAPPLARSVVGARSGSAGARNLRWAWAAIAGVCGVAAFVAWMQLSARDAERDAERERAAARRALMVEHRPSIAGQSDDGSRTGKPPMRNSATRVSLESAANKKPSGMELPVASDGPDPGTNSDAGTQNVATSAGSANTNQTTDQTADPLGPGPFAGTDNSGAQPSGDGTGDPAGPADGATAGQPDGRSSNVAGPVEPAAVRGQTGQDQWNLLSSPGSEVGPGSRPGSNRWLPILVWALLCGGVAALLCAVFFRRTIRRRRSVFVPGPWRYRRRIPDEQLQLFISERAIEDGAAALTWQARAESGQMLDIEGTVAATVEAGGFPTPAYQAPPASPEYAVLVDTSASAGPWRPVYDELFTRLASQGVRISRYEYRGSPELCTPVGSAREVTLAELAEERDSIIVVGDGAMAHDPFRRTRASWVSVLEHFPHRLWLNPLPPARWSESARELAHVVPMVHGASAVLGVLQPGADPPADSPLTYPAVIELAPASDVAMRALAGYLGPAAMRLLQLCAVAGEASSDMARFLAARLGARFSARPTEDGYLRLFGLPMFVSGRFASGRRERLRSALRANEPEAEAAVHEQMIAVLSESEPAAGSVAHLHWQLDRVVVDSRRGVGRERELSALALSPIHGDAERERIALGLRDRVARTLWSFTLVGVAALVVGAVLGYPALVQVDPAVRAEQHRAATDLGEAWAAVQACYYGTERALSDPTEALAWRLATTPVTQLDWARCTDGLAAVRTFASDVRDSSATRAGSASLGRHWRHLVTQLERAENSVRGANPSSAYRPLAERLLAVNLAYGQVRAALDLPPVAPRRAPTLATQVSDLLSDPLWAGDGEPITPLSAQTQGPAIVLRASASNAALRPAGEGAISKKGGAEVVVIDEDGVPEPAPVEPVPDDKPLAIAFGPQPEDIDYYSQRAGIVRAMAGGSWGLRVDETGTLRELALDREGRPVASEEPLVVSRFARARRSKSKKRSKKSAVRQRRVTPRYAIGRGVFRMAVAEERGRPGYFVNAQTKGLGSWRELGTRAVDIWREDWPSGRVLSLSSEGDRLTWQVFTESRLTERMMTTRENSPNAQKNAQANSDQDAKPDLERLDAGPVRSGCLACDGFWTVHERGAYRVTGDGEHSQRLPLPSHDQALSACSDDELLTVTRRGDGDHVAYRCTSAGCVRVATIPARPSVDLAIGVFADVGPIIAYADLGLLTVWRQERRGAPMTPVPVARIAEGLWVAAIQVWDGALALAARDERRVWLAELPWPDGYAPLRRADTARPSAYSEFVSIASDLDVDTAQMRAKFVQIPSDDPYICRAQPRYERVRETWLAEQIGSARGPDGSLACTDLEALRARVQEQFPKRIDAVADLECTCLTVDICNSMDEPPACCRKYEPSPDDGPIQKQVPEKQVPQKQNLNKQPAPAPKTKSKKTKSKKTKSKKTKSKKTKSKKTRPPVKPLDQQSGRDSIQQKRPADILSDDSLLDFNGKSGGSGRDSDSVVAPNPPKRDAPKKQAPPEPVEDSNDDDEAPPVESEEVEE